ncbi:MAG TPA: anti-sigma factor [Actinomycetota bacterium]|nr:anti-sigma factor [Actinomycetota bacterium]
MRDHTRIEELLAASALDGLGPADETELARERSAHGEECEECRALDRGFAEVAGRLALALDPVRVRDGLEDELVSRATGSVTRARAPHRGWRALVAVAAAFALFAGGWLARGPGDGTTEGLADFLPGARLVAFEGAEGDLALAYRPGERGAYVIGDLVEPGEGLVYEVWTIRHGSPSPDACIRPEADGTVLAYLDSALEESDVMAVTIESEACPGAPTTEPILIAELASL